jgi:hypothetical protein
MDARWDRIAHGRTIMNDFLMLKEDTAAYAQRGKERSQNDGGVVMLFHLFY